MSLRETIIDTINKQAPEVMRLSLRVMVDAAINQGEGFFRTWANLILRRQWRTAERELLKGVKSSLLKAEYEEVLTDWRLLNVRNKLSIKDKQAQADQLFDALITVLLAAI
jgi:hypothetical protein